MLQRYAQRFARLGLRTRLAGQGLPERMRTATVALLGVTAAISMAFVAVIAQQGWSVFPLGPIPGLSAGPQALSDGTAVSTGEGKPVASAGGGPGLVAAAELTAGSQDAQPGRAPAQPPAGKLSGSRPLAQQAPVGEPPSTPPSSGGETPGTPTTPPASQPVSAGANPPASTSEPGKGTAAVQPRGNENGKGSDKEKSKGKSKSSAPAPAPPPTAKPERPPEEEKTKAEDPAEPSSHAHGHGYGHRK
jgi:hypothetical protein